MSSKRKVTQDDLRKMMADIKSGSNSASKASKKLKLSSRELALIEEQKRQKALRDQEKAKLKQDRLARTMPNKDLVPQKSILKNSGSGSSYAPDPAVSKSLAAFNEQRKLQPTEPPREEDKPEIVSKPVVVASEPATNGSAADEAASSLPEGFFDDPVADAKARNVQYVDAEEEEWQKFQKEIADEMTTAQDILVEDRNEATADRQIEEIDEQIQAWSRVAVLEKKKDFVAQTIKDAKSCPAQSNSDESDDDVDPDDLSDWRKKC